MYRSKVFKNTLGQGKLNREWKDKQYFYTLITDSKTVSQNPLSNSETQQPQDFTSKTTAE